MQDKPYSISNDHSAFESLFPIPEELNEELSSLQNKLYNENNTSVITKLTRLQKKYPNNPHLMCDIATYYTVRHNQEKAKELYKQVIKKHKEYTFAYVSLAHYFILEENFNEAAQYLGEDFLIENLIPTRKTFYIEEVKAYLFACFNFFLFQAELPQAEEKLYELESLDPDDDRLEESRNMLMLARDEFSDEGAYDDEDFDTPELPKFQIDLIEDLFEFGYNIPSELIGKLLKEDRNALIADLELVLDYAYKHSKYFLENIVSRERRSFVLHTFLLLKELRAKESLEKCIDFLTLDIFTLDYWFEDYKDSKLWEVFHSFDIELNYLKEYIINNCTKDYFFSNIANQLLWNNALLEPGTTVQVGAYYEEIIKHIDSIGIENGSCDEMFLGSLIDACVNLKFKNLLPQIERIHEKNDLESVLFWSIEEIKEDFENSEEAYFPKFHTINEVYEYLKEIDDSFTYDDDNDFDFEAENTLDHIFGKDERIDDPYHGMIRTFPPEEENFQSKVGRNDPCPCGSGKKYKKCCGGNE
jgi:hypothetical protein